MYLFLSWRGGVCYQLEILHFLAEYPFCSLTAPLGRMKLEISRFLHSIFFIFLTKLICLIVSQKRAKKIGVRLKKYCEI
ncbi:hypothetical protein HMPREF9391_1638 [Streptococcus sanguinis SK408]|uniref:Uncharacterized protein n=1 Tax=Streptococcus sanguinis SK408 TaxID=888818 RepID=F2CG61_STRSA|nr:hypothetical protein HMPREF9391_1638 [Streptococcus sanguinis SK408]